MNYLLLLVLFFVSSCGIISPKFETRTFQERIAQFPKSEAPISSGVRISWDKHSIPYVSAETDEDLFFGLGTAQAHLRLGQMEVLRRLSQGRISEMAGPYTTEIDHALRILNLGKSSEEIFRQMQQPYRAYLSAFVRGINWYATNSVEHPPEFEVLGIEFSPWAERDVLTLSRLAGADLSWIFYATFLRIEDELERERLWQKRLDSQAESLASFKDEQRLALLQSIFKDYSKSGSNSFILSPSKTEHGGSIIANDPHLGISIPNFWLIAAARSPSFNVAGMMIPGLPFFALGRNSNIAWGGTNLRGISSHLYRLDTDVPTTLRKDIISVRWWFDKEIEIRETEFGPIISDADVFEYEGPPVAIKWVGHTTDSNEVVAFLKANQAQDFEEFTEAFKGYAVSGQNILYADTSGNIGHILAYRQPLLKDPSATLDLFKEVSNPIVGYRNSEDLPSALNPAQGFIASANNRPAFTEVPLSLSYANNQRFERLRELINEKSKFSLADVKEIQTDVYSARALVLKNKLLTILRSSEQSESQIAILLEEWDGHFSADSRGAVAFHFLSSAFIDKYTPRILTKETERSAFRRGEVLESLILDELTTDVGLQNARDDLLSVLPEVEAALTKFNNWGDVHRQVLQHPIGNVPIIGRAFKFAEYGAAGSNNTLLKSGHDRSLGRHKVTYGAQSRHVSDMSDLDENYFVLLGGQDGWLKNEQLIDQLALWQENKYIQVPLSSDGIEEFSIGETQIVPAAQKELKESNENS